MAQPVKELGMRAVKLLMKRIEAPDGKKQTVRLAPTLRIRNSCGCL
jgi:LacI family transcriptional regulator